MHLVLQRCCGTGWVAMLRVLPLTFKPVNNLICCKTGLMWVVKRKTSLFNLFCSGVAGWRLHVFCCLFFRTLRVVARLLLVTGKTQSSSPSPCFVPGELGPLAGDEGGGGGEEKGIGICNCRSSRRRTTLEKRSREAWGKKVAHGAQVQVKPGFINK